MGDYTVTTHFNRTNVTGPGGDGFVVNLFPMGLGYNAFADEPMEFVGCYGTEAEAIAALVTKLSENESAAIAAGDRVREAARRVPAGCEPFEATVLGVAPDGWVMVQLGPRSFSFPPGDVVKIEEE